MSDNGRWITTDKGVHIFIKDGQTVEQAMAEKFDSDEENDIELDTHLPDNEHIKKTVQSGTSEFKDAALFAFNKRLKSIVLTNNEGNSFYTSRNGVINLDNAALLVEGDLVHFPGEVIYHEIGHSVDNSLSDGGGQSDASNTYISQEFGMTLHDMVKAELRKIRKPQVEELQKMKQAYIDEEYRNLGFTPKMIEEIYAKYDEYRDIKREVETALYNSDPEFQKAKDAYMSWDQESYKKYDEMRKKAFSKIPGYSDFRRQYDDFLLGSRDAVNRGAKRYFTEVGVVSDILSSRPDLSPHKGLGVGHSEYYYKRAENKDWSYGCEFFANVFARYAGKQESSLEITKKYFPNSVKIFNEIMRRKLKWTK